ncbi:MAG: ribonuclease H-like domain-containing protein [archaeon]
MLTNTFLHIPYVNEKTEQDLWRNNVTSWDEFEEKKLDVPHKDLIKKFIHLSKEHYQAKNFEFFSSKLLFKHHWRAYDDFKDSCCFLDIETTGLSKYSDDITTIGLFDGNKSKVFINGQNMQEFEDEIKKYSFLVTFNGALFDLPFLKTKFPGIKFNQLHADLRFVLKSLGYSGGLKKIEKEFGINREGDLANMDGRDAVKLWHLYKRYNDKKALDRLVRYNIEDIENLKILMEYAYAELKDRCFSV